MKPSRPVPTAQELEILKVIWRRGPATVREVYLDLLKQRKIAYTTVLTMMGILEQKRYLKRKAGERAYVYSPTEPQSKVTASIVKEFVKRVFNGARTPLLVHLIEDDETNPEELEKIEGLLRSRRKNT